MKKTNLAWSSSVTTYTATDDLRTFIRVFMGEEGVSIKDQQYPCFDLQDTAEAVYPE